MEKNTEVRYSGENTLEALITKIKSTFYLKDSNDLLKYTEMDLTDQQMAQVRENIGAGEPVDIDAVLAQAKESGEFDGRDGEDGYTPVKGTDYWTDADKAEIKSYVDNAILGGEW